MKAAVCRHYGQPEVLEIKDIAKPIPKKHEVLIKVMATTVSSGDCRVRGANFPRGLGFIGRLALGWSGPRKPVLGTELSGVVEALGSDVTHFKVGDPIIAYPGIKMGAHAEYCVLPENGALVRKPDNLSFPEASALGFGGLTALYYLRDRANVQAGESVLIVGASGAVGVAAVQLAKHFGADVTAVCSGKNEDLVRSLGAQQVIDYTQKDFTRLGKQYDIILDTTGKIAAAQCKNVLKKNGRLMLISADLMQMLEPLWAPLKEGRKVMVGPAPERAEDLQFLVDLANHGVYKAVIERSFPLAQISQAHAYVETGRKRGSVVVTIA
jgi:NADPH:quinone reductase-like Zn-dependent oxidoreductase